jgi:hypothetical protein
MKWKYIEDTHLPPKISKCIKQSFGHSYCKRETSLTKLKSSKSVMILVVRITSSLKRPTIILCEVLPQNQPLGKNLLDTTLESWDYKLSM